MKWMEVIQVRTASNGGGKGFSVIQDRVANLRNAAGLLFITLLKHQQYLGDIAAVLVWNDQRQPVKTREGYALADTMAQYGSIDHAVWEVVAEQQAMEESAARQKRHKSKGI